MIYRPPSGATVAATRERINVIRDVAREILSAVSGLALLGPPGGVVWRGQANIGWRLESSMGRLGFTADDMATQEREMLREAREVGADNAQHLGDWEILARLRHHGAATRLIDFTTDPLVALWFLCDDETVGEDGRTMRDEPGVLLAMRREALLPVHRPYERNYDLALKREPANLLFKTSSIDPRIAAQRGVFAFSTHPLTSLECAESELGLPVPGATWCRDAEGRLAKVCDVDKWANKRGQPLKVFPDLVGIEVPARAKSKLLDVLATSHGFTQASMYPDFPGLARAFAGRRI